MDTIKFAKKLAIPLFVALAYGPSQGLAASILAPNLETFAVLGASTVTNVSPLTAIIGNVGDWDGIVAANAVVGLLPTQVSGTIYSGPALATSPEALAQTQLDAAILAVSAFGVGTTIAGGDLDAYQASHGGSITPGVYTLGAGSLVGALNLNGLGNANAVWVFQMASTLTTGTTSTVTVTNVGLGAGVGLYWNVGSSATLNGNTFAGNVLAQASISSDGGLQMGCGRLLAATAAVTLAGAAANTISTGCLGVGAGSSGFDQAGVTSPIPEPETYTMLLAGLGMMGFVARRRQRNLAAAA